MTYAATLFYIALLMVVLSAALILALGLWGLVRGGAALINRWKERLYAELVSLVNYRSRGRGRILGPFPADSLIAWRGDMLITTDETHPVARIPHVCDQCGKTIPPGMRYERMFALHSYVRDGEMNKKVAQVYKTCRECIGSVCVNINS